MAEESSGASFTDLFSMDPSDVVDDEHLPLREDLDDTADERPTPDAPPEDGAQAQPSFIPDDVEMTPAIQARIDAINAKMQQNYAKRTAGLQDREKSVEDARQAREIVQRFYSDPQYASQVLQQRAQQLGYTLTPASGTPPVGQPPQGVSPATTPTGQQMPDWVTAAAHEAFADQPELAFLAPKIAKAAWIISQANVHAATEPLKKDAETRQHEAEALRRQARQAEVQRATAELEADGIDVLAHDEELSGFAEFLRNALSNTGPVTHPKYGNAVRIIYNLATGDRNAQSTAQAEAERRREKATVNRTSQGTAARSPGANIQDLMRKATTPQERVTVAFRDALAQLRNR
jgi:hypothetical protein